jgi:hypothetical protein
MRHTFTPTARRAYKKPHPDAIAAHPSSPRPRPLLASLTSELAASHSHLAACHEPVGQEANDFGHCYLQEWEACTLYEEWYMAPSDFRLPDTWRLSAGGIPIPPVPHGAARSAAIHQHFYEGLMAEERADPLWDPDNEDQWTTFFTNRRNHELARYERNGPPSAAPSHSSLTTMPRATNHG